MDTFAVADIKNAARLALEAMVTLEQELNDADAKLGDGDTGGMLARVLQAMGAASIPDDADVGACFMTYARAAATATGSSLGTLFATALMTLAKETKGRAQVPVSELGRLLGNARDAMMARGGAGPGDKTVLDALDRVATEIAGKETAAEVRVLAVSAGQAALDAFRGQPNRIGRARMFADATIGLDDPGMLAFVKFTQAICKSVP